MAAGETFAVFLENDPLTTALPLPALSSDRLAVVRGGWTYYASALAFTGGMQVITPVSGDTVEMTTSARALYVNAAELAVLTILLPAGVDDGAMVEISFATAVETLTILDAATVTIPSAPTSGAGPGAAIQMRYVNAAIGWVYWK